MFPCNGLPFLKVVDRKRTRPAEETNQSTDSGTDNAPATPTTRNSGLVFSLAHASLPDDTTHVDKLIRDRLNKTTIADFLSVPDSPARSGASTPSRSFEEARTDRVRGYAQRSRATRYKVVSVNRQGLADEANGESKEARYELYDALAEEEAVRLAETRKGRGKLRAGQRPTAPSGPVRNLEADEHAARMAAILPMLQEYLKVHGGGLTEEELNGGSAAPRTELAPAAEPAREPEPATETEDFVYDLYVAHAKEPEKEGEVPYEGEELSAEEWRQRLLSKSGVPGHATAGELVWLDDTDEELQDEDDDGNSDDSEDSNGWFKEL